MLGIVIYKNNLAMLLIAELYWICEHQFRQYWIGGKCTFNNYKVISAYVNALALDLV